MSRPLIGKGAGRWGDCIGDIFEWDLVCREIRFASTEYVAALALRDRVLRQPLGLKFTDEELSRDKGDLHLGAFAKGRLIACLILTLSPLAGLPGAVRLTRMRQVAVDPLHQGLGVGKALVDFAERLARQRGFAGITLNAREHAVLFYRRLGYETQGPPFKAVTLVHWRMFKTLKD